MFAEKQYLQTAEETELRALLYDYFSAKGFLDVATKFKQDCKQKNLPWKDKPLDKDNVTNFDDKRSKLVELFDQGSFDNFFVLWEDVLGDETRNVTEIAVLEFYLRLYFALYPLRSADDEDASRAAEKSVQFFKKYLDGPGAKLSQTAELVPFYALPYVRQPKLHPLFKDLFQPAWCNDLRGKLLAALDGRKRVVAEPKLARLYKKLVATVGAGNSHDSTRQEDNGKELDSLVRKFATAQQKLTYLDKKCSAYNEQFERLKADYQQLLGISQELVDALEQNVRGAPVSLPFLEDVCARLGHATASAAAAAKPAAESPQVLNLTSLHSTLEEGFPKEEEEPADLAVRPVLTIIDYNKIKRAFDKEHGRLGGFLFQALRWMVTKNPLEVRGEFLDSYIVQDILGCKTDFQKRKVLQFFDPGIPSDVRESACRFINMLASVKSGRRYLIQGNALLNTLANVCKKESLPTTSNLGILRHAVAALQKLSLRRNIQNSLIKLGVIDWLVRFLEKFQKLDDYILEYCVALLMNLSLRTAGKYRCADRPKQLLTTLRQLLMHGNKEIYPYVNGTLYSILSLQAVRKCASEMKMLKSIEELYKKAQCPSLKKQLPYVIKQLKGEVSEKEGQESSEDEDDDDEDDEEDSLEPELDDADPLKPNTTELVGEQLLREKFASETATYASASVVSEAYGSNQSDLSNAGQRPSSSRGRRRIERSVVSTTFTQHDATQRQLTKPIVRSTENQEQISLDPPKKLPPVPVPDSSRGRSLSRTDSQAKFNYSRIAATTESPSVQSPATQHRKTVMQADSELNGTADADGDADVSEHSEAKQIAPTFDPPLPAPAIERVNTRVPTAHRVEYISAFGSRPKLPRTPNLDALKKRGAAATLYF